MNRFSTSLLLVVALCVTALSLGYIVFNSSTSPLAVIPIDSSSQLAQSSAPTSGLVAHLTFDNSLNDASGNNNDGSWSGSSDYGSGKIGSGSASFGGSNYITINKQVYSTSGGTVAFWFKKNGSGGILTGSWGGSNNQRAPTLSIQNGKLAWEYGDSYANITSSSIDNGWHHVAMSFSGSGQVRIYLDGSRIVNKSVSKPNDFLDQVHIGHYGNYGSSFGSAYIDDFRIYDNVLSSSDISSLYSYTGVSVDTSGPSISGVSVSDIQTDRATISWNTDEPADTYVEFGLTSSHGSNSALTDIGSSMTTSHTQILAGLEQDTTYHYRVASKDASGNISFSPDATFTTAKSVSVPPVSSGPVISNVSVSDVQTDRATIKWSTNTPSDSEVFFGIGNFNSHSTLKDTGSSMTTYHVQILAGLKNNSSYQYYVQSRDASGKLTKSSTGTFTTGQDVPTSDKLSPSVPSGLVGTVVSSSQINLSWNASSDNVGVTGYQVFRDGVQIANITPAVTSFQNNTGLLPGTTYRYKVTAYDAEGNVSAPSSEIAVKTQSAQVLYSITVSKSGTGTGTVVSSGTSYINCGNTCSSTSIPEGQSITLYATPTTGSKFIGWSGACNGSASTCTVTTASNLTIGAVFSTALPQVTDGTSINITPGVPFSFELTKAGTYKLTGTVTAADGGRNSFYVDIDSKPTTDGKVWDIQYPISSTQKDVTWRGNNTTCYEYSCAGVSPKTWTLSAGTHTLYLNTREPGTSISAIRFVSYVPSVGDGASPSVPSGLSANAISSSQINLSWNASSDNVGVTGYRVYRDGSFLTTVNGTSYVNTGLSANTSYSYTVLAFDAAGNSSGQSIPASARTESNPSYTVTVTKSGTGAGTVTSGGSINCGNSCVSSGDPGMTVTLTAIPATGSVFTGWSGVSGCSSSTVCSFTLNSNTNITATFNAVTINQPPVVSVSASPTTATAPAVIALSATASDPDGTIASVSFYNGQTLLSTDTSAPYSYSWTGVSAGTYSVTARATDNSGLSATSNTVAVNVSVVNPPTGVFSIGEQVHPIYSTINVRQTPGGTLVGTQPDTSAGTIVAGPISAVLSVDGVTYTWWNVNFASGVDGWVGEDGIESYTVPASTRFQTGSEVQVSGTGTFLNIRNAPSITATAVGSQNDGAVGTVISNGQNGIYADGYYWWNINFNSGVDGWAVEEYLAPYVDPNATYTLTVTTSGSGTVTRSPNLTSYPVGTSVTLTANPASDYVFSGWSGACTGVSACSVTMNGNMSVNATFSPEVVGGSVYYVTPSGAGSKNGSSWANAYADLPSTLVSGATYMLQPGSYKALNVTSSGTTNAPIVIRRSLELAPNEPVSSSDAITFAVPSIVTGNNVIIDGKGWHGITFTANRISTQPGLTSTQGASVILAGSNNTLRNAYLNGTFGAGQGHSLGIRLPGTGTTRVEYNDFYQSAYEDQMTIVPSATGGDVVFDHNVFRDNVKKGESNPPHRDIVNTWTGSGGYGLVVSNNIYMLSSDRSPQGDGFLLQDAYGGGAAALKYVRVYNNVAYHTARLIAFGSKNSGWSQEFKVYNNTLVNTTGISTASPAGSPTTKNGLSSTSSVNNGSPSTIESMYGADGKPFTSDDAFALKSATSGGSTISTTDLNGPQYDITGKLRTGSPDLGAYEF